MQHHPDNDDLMTPLPHALINLRKTGTPPRGDVSSRVVPCCPVLSRVHCSPQGSPFRPLTGPREAQARSLAVYLHPQRRWESQTAPQPQLLIVYRRVRRW